MDNYIQGWRIVWDSGCVLLWKPGNRGIMQDHCILAKEGRKFSLDTAFHAAEEYIESQKVTAS